MKFYSNVSIVGTETMKEVTTKLGFDILQPNYYMSMGENERDEETYKQITLNNLCNTGLLQKEVKLVSNGRREHISYKITTLGRLILKKIGEDVNY